jgi:hypothetical protein
MFSPKPSYNLRLCLKVEILMSDEPGLILLMGSRTEHAITSIQYFVPSVVHIVTSTDFKTQHSRRLKKWAEKYGFRKGEVLAVSDLFESTSFDSILSKICEIADIEKIGESKTQWMIGITGGAMHMAATGTYAALLLRMWPFYVIQPPKGQEPMPNRDVLEFPSFSGLRFAKNLKADDLVYLSQGKGEMEDFAKRFPEELFRSLCNTGLMTVKGSEWSLTSEGKHTIEFTGRSTPVMEVLAMQKAQMEKENEEEIEGCNFYIG